MEAKDLELRMVRETHSILLSSKKKVVGGAYSCMSLPFDCFKLTASSQKSLVGTSSHSHDPSQARNKKRRHQASSIADSNANEASIFSPS